MVLENEPRGEKRRPGRRPTQGITEHQLRTLKVIQKFIMDHAIPPTVADIAGILDLRTSTVHEQISQLISKGYLRRADGKARSLAVVQEPNDPIKSLSAVPIIGKIAAGLPILASENIIGEVLVDVQLIKTGRYFALEVWGDSMINAGIHSGDLLIVRQQPVAESGDIVVALLGDEATVKRLCIQGDDIQLRPENPEYPPIVIGSEDELRIAGKVVAVRSTASSTR